jgi:NAD(P)-dependent dehydrogenase (short-subunit alcohol dehydrogenase family)
MFAFFVHNIPKPSKIYSTNRKKPFSPHSILRATIPNQLATYITTMAGKTYLITGANRGLGLEFVRQITSASPNNTVIACVRSLQGELDDLKSLASSKSDKVHIVECDTSSVSSIKKAGEEISTLVSDGQLHYLLNNAGINSVSGQTALTINPEDLHKHIDTNVIGPSELFKALQKHLDKGSVVLNMSSGLGSVGKGIVKCTTYAVSKAALNMLTVHQAEVLKEKSAVAIVMDPGWVQTRMGGEGAILTPEESIGGMLKVLHSVTLEESGRFYQYDGKTVLW